MRYRIIEKKFVPCFILQTKRWLIWEFQARADSLLQAQIQLEDLRRRMQDDLAPKVVEEGEL